MGGSSLHVSVLLGVAWKMFVLKHKTLNQLCDVLEKPRYSLFRSLGNEIIVDFFQAFNNLSIIHVADEYG